MTISVASGKGGTGKTSVAVGLALVAAGAVEIVDADVEEPNVQLFLKPETRTTETISVPIPSVDETRCDLCGACAEACEYNAIAVLSTGPLVFPELCHGCGGCTMVCPREAIREVDRPIGVIHRGTSDGVEYAGGRLNVGEAMATPLIRELVRTPSSERLRIVDVPPGVSCPAIAGTRLSDYVILVAEPTRFGLADLEMAVEAVRLIERPFGVIINRANDRPDDVTEFCRREGIPVLLRIPERRSIAAAYCRGESMLSAEPSLRSDLIRVLEHVLGRLEPHRNEENPAPSLSEDTSLDPEPKEMGRYA
jgi:MinD superfamily P-loop ATPase